MRTILKDLSRNYLMFIQWEGVVKDDRLCFDFRLFQFY